LSFTERAPAKVNLALHVLGRRHDGYHELDSIVAFADAADRLTFVEAPAWGLDIVGPFAEGLGNAADNLVLKAAHAFAEAYSSRTYRIKLEKNLPIASGIGGGSADAAACLRALAAFAAVADRTKLISIAATLGADVPVCLLGRTCRMRGMGEYIEMLPATEPMPAVLVNPGLPLATAQVFAKLALAPGDMAFDGLDGSVDLASCRNDLTQPALAIAPVIGDVLAALEAAPDIRFARMSGSGATCFGVFSSAAAAEGTAHRIMRDHPDWWTVPTIIG
jgi:4-diphosphocytidyl-2-C-methyl-D-erythritol kinase